MHSTSPLVPMVRLVPMELHLFDCCFIGEMDVIIDLDYFGWLQDE